VEKIFGETDSLGNFNVSYRTTFADPAGQWTLELESVDYDGNSGLWQRNITVSPPLGVLYYNVVFLNPIDDASYFRGEIIPISVQVLDINNPVSNANVSLKLPNGKLLDLSEESEGSGIYRANYRIPYSMQQDFFNLSVSAVKQGDSGLYGGARSIKINVRQVQLNVIVEKPLKNNFLTGEGTDIRVRVEYPDGTPATGITVKVTPTNKTVNLYEVGNGIYEGSYTFNENDAGIRTFRILASDESQNLAFLDRTISISRMNLLDAILFYWYFTVAVLSVAGYALLRSRYQHLLIFYYDRRINSLNQLKKSAQERYFVENQIDETTFNNLISKTESQIVEFKSRIKELEKSLETSQKDEKNVIGKIFETLKSAKSGFLPNISEVTIKLEEKLSSALHFPKKKRKAPSKRRKKKIKAASPDSENKVYLRWR
jgi:hypothetical protein